MSTTAINSFFGYVFWLLAARLFSADVVGLTAALISASTIIVLLAGLGVGGTLIQSLPKAGGSAVWSLTFWAGMATALILGATAALATVVWLPLLADQFSVLRAPGFAAVFCLGTLAMIAGSILDYAFLAERAAGQMLLRSSSVAIGKVLLIVSLTLVGGATALAMLGSWAAAAAVGLGLGAGLLVRRVWLRAPARPSALLRRATGLRSGLAGQQLIGMGSALLPYLLSLVVAVRLSATDNAYFFTTWMMSGIFLIIAPAVSLSLFAEGSHDPNDLRIKTRSALSIIAAILVPGVVAVLAVGGTLLSAFGPAYERYATDLLYVVLLAAFPDAITNVYVAVLRVQGRLRVASGLTMGMGIGTVALSWALIPVIGIVAVGWAFLTMQLAGCLFVLVDLLRSQPAQTETSPLRTETS